MTTTTRAMTDAPAGFIAVSVFDPVAATASTLWLRAAAIQEIHPTPEGRAYVYLQGGGVRYVLESPAELSARLTRAIYGALIDPEDHHDD